ncbi:uncharacterized protein LOC143552193 [Bidens hawaiensis]|uniref:uncharacterized protein LOC143552193 n=1 Tax=Bidens hawaiensis TaxID=980011 RepID=UPI0040491595
MSSYCEALKVLADQLANVDAPVNNDSPIIQLITGLGDQYETTATIISNMKPLPDFYEARSKLCMYEGQPANNTAYAAKTATHALHTNTTAKLPSSDILSERGHGRGRSHGRGRGRNPSGHGRSTFPGSQYHQSTYN